MGYQHQLCLSSVCTSVLGQSTGYVYATKCMCVRVYVVYVYCVNLLYESIVCLCIYVYIHYRLITAYTHIAYTPTLYIPYTGDMILTGSYQTDAAHAGFTGTVSRIYKTHGLAGFYIGILIHYILLYTAHILTLICFMYNILYV